MSIQDYRGVCSLQSYLGQNETMAVQTIEDITSSARSASLEDTS